MAFSPSSLECLVLFYYLIKICVHVLSNVGFNDFLPETKEQGPSLLLRGDAEIVQTKSCNNENEN